MLRIAICDGGLSEGNKLITMLKICEKQKNEAFYVDLYTEGRALLMSGIHYDVVFLETQLPHDDGIEVGLNIWKTDKNCHIIYTTNVADFCEAAQNKVHAFAYLKKPVSQGIIDKQIDDILSVTIKKEHRVKSLKLATIRQGYQEIPICDIYYFEYKNRKVDIHTTEQIYTIKESISEMISRMTDYDFVTPHQSFLVNLNYVNNIQNYEITLKNGEIIPVSQKRSALIRKIFHDYINRK